METLEWKVADFFEITPPWLTCTLCPHACRLEDGEVGGCMVRRRHGLRMETATFASSVEHLDPVERKPLYHFRPGSLALTLAAPGCSLACRYCENWRISQYGRAAEVSWDASPVDVDRVVADAAGHGAAIALSYSEPGLAAELTLALAERCRSYGVELLWKTNGFITSEALTRLAPSLAAVNIDLKAADDARHKALTGAPLGPVLDSLAGFVEHGVWVEVSTPLIPGVTTDASSLRKIAASICEVDPDIPWHLLRVTPQFRMRHLRPTRPDELARALAIGHDAGLHFVYVERALGTTGRNTRCPDCGRTVISRDVGSTRRTVLTDGACPTCGRKIPGRWQRQERKREGSVDRTGADVLDQRFSHKEG